MNTARENGGGAGTQTAALAFAGSVPPTSAATEEWNDPVITTRTIDTD